MIVADLTSQIANCFMSGIRADPLRSVKLVGKAAKVAELTPSATAAVGQPSVNIFPLQATGILAAATMTEFAHVVHPRRTPNPTLSHTPIQTRRPERQPPFRTVIQARALNPGYQSPCGTTSRA